MTTRRLRRFTPLLFAVLAVSVASCGGNDLSPVSGRVLVAGKPANNAIVMFIPENPPSLNDFPSTATTADDGTFTLVSGATGGARPGKYIVTVVWPDPNKKFTDAQKMMGFGPSDAPDVLKGRYATREKSPLRAEVRDGPNSLTPFELK
jgi:hypothetical protein